MRPYVGKIRNNLQVLPKERPGEPIGLPVNSKVLPKEKPDELIGHLQIQKPSHQKGYEKILVFVQQLQQLQ